MYVKFTRFLDRFVEFRLSHYSDWLESGNLVMPYEIFEDFRVKNKIVLVADSEEDKNKINEYLKHLVRLKIKSPEEIDIDEYFPIKF
ncbi:hypothetical protein JGI7_00874 [Candidatus Kryptonium thompsonii]|jgi:hypothetical protein|uniref:Uncharacterized protein n=1 Tax=Candidatus Kryptonium thompsonii TaxID=1633631 RepID=A0A0P1LNS5_9BACT|nr:hypothetical protein [Candidatus Kryptonium thompsoni]CUS77486.1 hypothetical protein JGI16_10064 [Candidatus Kryptonium thompsoni]CUS81876.1 hypothetical protein JGI15_101222 [Candidatus Kryptonium thompsoni]CUS83851.1 hypothetical protein JGI13_00982 [Candidatus Kryptonium thompsoni]CUS84604.1 hypothetical protein JGI6_00073 [Candidatus Kryptonium thompsoni]CUS85139.1 hypothetical protein JGI7_00874 [Candidatus Kryptonium thompsoni]